MPLETDHSLIADSTMSTSPQREPSPQVLKRSTRTYGRKRSPVPETIISDPFDSQPEPPNHSVLRTAPPNLKEYIPATSSDGGDTDDDKDPNDQSKSTFSGKGAFKYGWRAELDLIDQRFNSDDDDDSRRAGSSFNDAPEPLESGFGPQSLLFQSKASGSDDTRAGLRSIASPTAADAVSGSLSRGDPTSPPISPSLRRAQGHGKKGRPGLIADSDSEAEHPATSPLTNTSPADLHPINTPIYRSSVTPPTDHDLPLPPSGSSKAQGKKGSSLGSRRNVPVLKFQQSPPSFEGERRSSEDRKKRKHKAPTKKDREETAKERVRLVAEKDTSIPKAQGAQRFTMQEFFSAFKQSSTSTGNSVRDASLAHPEHLVRKQPIGGTEPSASEAGPRSSPILSFSSPIKHSQSSLVLSAAPVSPLPSSSTALPPLPTQLDSDDDELPDGLEVLKESEDLADKSKRIGDLKELKQRLLNSNTRSRPAEDDDDDDLEIIPTNPAVQKLEEEHSKSQHKAMSRTRRAQMHLAGVDYLKPPAQQANSSAKGKGPAPMAREQYDYQLWHKVKKESVRTIEKKKQAWLEIGGKVLEPLKAEVGTESALGTYVEKGLKAAQAKDLEDEKYLDEDSKDGSDDEWNPEERGSASPEPNAMDADDEVDGDITMVDEGCEDTTSDDNEDENTPLVFHGHRGTVVIDSDEENDENVPPMQMKRPLAARRPQRLDEDALSMDIDELSPATDDRMDDGTDKENNAGLIFDRSEDKENKAVVRFESLGDDENASPSRLRRDLSFDLELPELRRPFQELSGSLDAPKVFELGRSNLTQLFEAQLSGPRRTPELDPFIGNSASKGDGDGFSQFSDDEPTLLGQPSSQPNLTDLFEATTQKPKSSTWLLQENDLGEPFTEKPLVNKLRNLVREDSLDLTQDLVLQPAFQPKEDVLRKANDIFEKEQEFVLESVFKQEDKKPELYVNEDGFLTQTRPDVPNPEIYHPPSPTQKQNLQLLMPTPGTATATPLETRFGHRSPLRTLSLSDPTLPDSPGNRPLRRLRKRSASPSALIAPVEVTKRRDAFAVLQEGAQHGERKRRRLDKSEFVASEAEESDDEGDFWGERRKRKAVDDEEEGEDLDKALESLVDDHVMDDKTLAEQAVREKFKEQEELDDQWMEEEANIVIQGGWRKRQRKNGASVSDDSDEEGDEDENQRLRRKMHKKKKREDVEALEKNAETKAFAEIYQATLNDEDENEFAHLIQDDTQHVLAQLAVPDGDEYYDDDEDNDSEKPGAEYITPSDLRTLVQERAKHPTKEPRMDPNDTAWVDRDEDKDEDEIRIKTIKPSIKKPSRSRQLGLDPSELDDGLEDDNLNPEKIVDERQQKQAQSWALREGRNRQHNGSTRSVGGAAITGLRTKAGGGSLRKATKAASDPLGPNKPAVKKTASVLSAVDRSSRFS